MSKTPRTIHVQAHRGASAELMENTLPAFQRALEIGADSVELDVHPARSGGFAVFHDFRLDAPTPTPTSKRKSVRRIAVSSLSLTELETIILPGSPRLAVARALTAEEQRIPCLDDVFALFRRSSHPHAARIIVDIEIKSLRRSKLATEPGELARRLLVAVARGWDLGRTVIRSFDHRVLQEVRRQEPSVRIAALTDRRYLNYGTLVRRLRPDIIAPPFRSLAYRRWLKRLHAEGVAVMPYTVNAPSDWAKLIAMGVDGITTDNPHGLVQFLQHHNLRPR